MKSCARRSTGSGGCITAPPEPSRITALRVLRLTECRGASKACRDNRAGILIGGSLACTASALAMSVSARAVAPQLRSLVYGIVSAAGSIGAMIAAPIGQGLANGYGWRIGVIGFVALRSS